LLEKTITWWRKPVGEQHYFLEKAITCSENHNLFGEPSLVGKNHQLLGKPLFV